MKKIITKRVYEVTLEGKAKNTFAEEDGITFGLQFIEKMFFLYISCLNKNSRTGAESKSRRVTFKKIHEE